MKTEHATLSEGFAVIESEYHGLPLIGSPINAMALMAYHAFAKDRCNPVPITRTVHDEWVSLEGIHLAPARMVTNVAGFNPSQMIDVVRDVNKRLNELNDDHTASPAFQYTRTLDLMPHVLANWKALGRAYKPENNDLGLALLGMLMQTAYLECVAFALDSAEKSGETNPGDLTLKVMRTAAEDISVIMKIEGRTDYLKAMQKDDEIRFANYVAGASFVKDTFTLDEMRLAAIDRGLKLANSHYNERTGKTLTKSITPETRLLAKALSEALRQAAQPEVADNIHTQANVKKESEGVCQSLPKTVTNTQDPDFNEETWDQLHDILADAYDKMSFGAGGMFKEGLEKLLNSQTLQGSLLIAQAIDQAYKELTKQSVTPEVGEENMTRVDDEPETGGGVYQGFGFIPNGVSYSFVIEDERG